MRKALLLTAVLTAALAAALSQARAPVPFFIVERARLRAHFDSVERELRAQTVPGWTGRQREARARLLDILHSYWLRGVFPRNTDFPDRDMPVFIDYWGTRCGVAYLMEQTGKQDLMRHIAATRNNARVPELKGDPEVSRWLAANGLTLAEATRIQPTYGCGTLHPDLGPSCTASLGYQVTTGVVVAANATAFTLNVLNTGVSPAAGAVVALGTGTAGLVAGIPNIGQSGQRGTLGLVNTGVGTASIALALIRLIGQAHPATPSRVTVAPWVAARARPGIAARVAF